MKQKIILLFIITNLTCYSQSIDSIQKMSIGKWTEIKYTTIYKGKNITVDTRKNKATYEFRSDGTYDRYYNVSPTMHISGKWKIIEYSVLKIYFYDNTELPDEPNITIADHAYEIIKFTENEFVISVFTEGPNEITTYVKPKGIKLKPVGR